MPDRGAPLRRLGILTIGQFDAADPAPGHEQTLRLIERAEELGFDSVWVRQRHFQPGISSPVALLAAASQRTNRITLGTAVIPIGLENPLRLAEDLAPGSRTGTVSHLAWQDHLVDSSSCSIENT